MNIVKRVINAIKMLIIQEVRKEYKEDKTKMSTIDDFLIELNENKRW